MKEIWKNILGSVSRQMSTNVINFVLIIVIARLYGPEDNGLYNIVMMLPIFMVTFLNFGIGNANTYYLSSKKIDLTQAFINGAFFYSLIFIFFTIFSFIVLYNFSNFLFPGIDFYLLCLSLIIFPILLFNNFILNLLQGIQSFRFYNILLILQPFLILIFSILFVRLEVFGLILAYILGSGIVLIVSLYLFFNRSDVLRFKLNYEYIKECLSYGWKAYLSNIIAFLNNKIDLYLINFFIGPVNAGLYVVATQISERITFLSQAVSVVLLPKISELISMQKEDNSLTAFMCRWVFWFTLTLAMIMAFFSEFIIVFLFGRDYLYSLIPFIILLIGFLFSSISKILANDFAARGKPELNLHTSWVTLVVNVILNIILIPKFGIVGAAISATTAYIINFILRVIIYSKYTKINFLSLILIPREEFIYIFRKIKCGLLK